MKESILKANGISLAVYERQGNTTPVFFVHGLFSNARTWRVALEQQCMNDIGIIAIDWPGHGRSERRTDPVHYRFLEISALIANVIEQKKLEDVLIVGHSIGGHIAMQVPRFTDKVSAAVIVAAAPIDDKSGLDTAYNLNEDITSILRGTITDDILCNAWLHDRRLLADIKESYHDTHLAFRRTIDQNIIPFIGAPEFLPENKLLKHKRVAFIYGEDEKLIKRSYLERMALQMPVNHSIHYVPGAAHFPQMESPAVFSSILSNFIREG